MSVGDVAFSFDGVALGNADTPEGKDMEDDDMIEAKVSIERRELSKSHYFLVQKEVGSMVVRKRHPKRPKRCREVPLNHLWVCVTRGALKATSSLGT